MEIAAVIVSVLAFVVSVVGTALANKRSKEALAESRNAARIELWSGVQESVQRLIGFDPASEPLQDRLANLRIAMIALVDGLDEDWKGFDEWLEAERALGAVLGRQVMEQARPSDTVAARLQLLDPMLSWAQALSNNLRVFRRDGYKPAQAVQLRDSAIENTRQVYEAHGWSPPPLSNPRLKVLEEGPS